jgi:hypothetical protein
VLHAYVVLVDDHPGRDLTELLEPSVGPYAVDHEVRVAGRLLTEVEQLDQPIEVQRLPVVGEHVHRRHRPVDRAAHGLVEVPRRTAVQPVHVTRRRRQAQHDVRVVV